MKSRVTLLLIVAVLMLGTILLLRNRTSERPRQEAQAAAAGNPDQERARPEVLQNGGKTRGGRPVDAGAAEPDWTASDPDRLEPFDQQELIDLAAEPKKNPRRLTELIFRAGAEKDVLFRDLVGRKDLREDLAMSLAVDAYDYSVNGNLQALETILELHAREGAGDSNTLWALSFLDEWDRTLAAVKSQPAGDSDAKYVFWRTRAQLYPENFRKFMKARGQRPSVLVPPGY